MSKAFIGEQLWAEVPVARKSEGVREGFTTTKQMTEGLLDSANNVLSRAVIVDPSVAPSDPGEGRSSQDKQRTPKASGTRPRCGLPEGFVTRLGRYGRSVLLEDNVYRLPNGQQFIPQPPTGTLGSRCHSYALLTIDQYEMEQRGSVYVRTDGRIFDYSFDNGDSTSEIFDTGYTIYDLERTGHYASQPVKGPNDGIRHCRRASSDFATQRQGGLLIRKLTSGKYRLYSKKKDPKTGKRRNLGTFNTRKTAKKHERAVQYFKGKRG
jgi:hypothetical protein